MRWLGLGGQTVKRLVWLACKFDLDQSERKSSQFNASARKPSEAKRYPSYIFQLASTYDSVWPGLKREKHWRDKETSLSGWRALTKITNDVVEKFRLNFSRRANRDVVPSNHQSARPEVDPTTGALNMKITILILSITKFSIVIGSPRAYLSCNRRAITWVSDLNQGAYCRLCCLSIFPAKLLICCQTLSLKRL